MSLPKHLADIFTPEFLKLEDMVANFQIENAKSVGQRLQASMSIPPSRAKLDAQKQTTEFKQVKGAMLDYLTDSCTDPSVVIADIGKIPRIIVTTRLDQLREKLVTAVQDNAVSVGGAGAAMEKIDARKKLGDDLKKAKLSEVDKVVAKPIEGPAYIETSFMQGFELIEAEVAKTRLTEKATQDMGSKMGNLETAIMLATLPTKIQAEVNTPESLTHSVRMLKYLIASCTDAQVLPVDLHDTAKDKLDALREDLAAKLVQKSEAALTQLEARKKLGGMLQEIEKKIEAELQK